MASKSRGRRRIVAYTDGSYIFGVGAGWGVRILFPGGRMLELGGYQKPAGAFAKMMEVRAVVEALTAMRKDVGEGELVWLVVNTDCWDVLHGVQKIRRGKLRHRNNALHIWWNQLRKLHGLDVRWGYVRGHRGHRHNERAHEIANRFARYGKNAGKELRLAGGDDEES